MDAKQFKAMEGKEVLYRVNLGEGRDADVQSGNVVALSTSGKYVQMSDAEGKPTWYDIDKITILEEAPKGGEPKGS